MKLSILIAVCVLSVAWQFAPQGATANWSDPKDAQARAAFAEAYKVFMHPRCVNCHPVGDSPLRGEDSRPHAGLRLRRGPDGKGVLTLKCTNCHQAKNQQGLHIQPAAPNNREDSSVTLTTPRAQRQSTAANMICEPHE